MPTHRPIANAGEARPRRRVALIHPGAMGDLVQAFPAFGAVRAAFPDAHLALFTDRALAELARGTELFDEVVGFDAAVAFGGGVFARLQVAASLAGSLRRLHPDDVGVFKGSPVYAVLAAFSGARRRVGLARRGLVRHGLVRRGLAPRGLVRSSDSSRHALLTHPIPIDPLRHHEDRFLDVAAALGADPARQVAAAWPARDSPIPADVRARARPLIGIAPGGARNAKQDMPTKRWPADRFAQLARELREAYPRAAFILLGGAGDRAELDMVRAELLAGDVVDVGGRTDVPAARAAIAALDVYVGNDSGLMHVAATTATPAVIAFGPTDPRTIAPRAPGLRAIWDPVPEPPCYDDVAGVKRPCATPCCMERVQVATMRAAVEAALAGDGA